MGPIVVFDKSTLQSLSVDEAVWLHQFYSANITPLFFIETLADLEKQAGKGRTPEQVVGSLAVKTSPMGARPNPHHQDLCRAELMGRRVEMRRVPVLGGQPFVTADGSGLVYRESPEQEALRRWQKGEFLQVERQVARAWRAALARLDLGIWKASYVAYPRPRTLLEAKEIAVRVVNRDGWRYRTLETALNAFGVPQDSRPAVRRRWRSAGGPALNCFAPYVAHVLTVDAFLGLCLQSGLISDKPASNRVDIAYLYYLPFCMVFTSGDTLHEDTVPLFLESDQFFIKAKELKADLKKLDDHYSCLPEETRQQGVMRFAPYPPTEGDFLTSTLWDQLMKPTWREDAARPPITKEMQNALLELVKKYSEASPAFDGVPDLDAVGALTLESRVPISLGKWRLLPPEVGKAS
jgi:hypothetical protein